MMMNGPVLQKLNGVVERVTFHGESTGWSILRVTPISNPSELVTVQVYQSQVFAGATLEFEGEWTEHPKYGRQFKAYRVVETKPATSAALEKYLGSGLIYGVGPKTAKKIVRYFKEKTLDIFETNISRLLEVPGIAEAKLHMIRVAWEEHREIRNVMMFLQTHGISTLYAVKIFKTYGIKSIEVVERNPYQLARDIYGIGFFSADQIATHLGFTPDSPMRLMAAIKHILSSARDEGHCYLTESQIFDQVEELLTLKIKEKLPELLGQLEEQQEIKYRDRGGDEGRCYYAKSLYYDEHYVATSLREALQRKVSVDRERVGKWLNRYCEQQAIMLSDEQKQSIEEITTHPVAILTGGPGCGKTTTTRVLVKLLLAMGKRPLLAAPTGRAAQRMTEVIGREAKTIHRLLIWNPSDMRFKKNEDDPLDTDFLVVDECSMIDIQLAASLLKATPKGAQILFIGDADQLPSVGAGNFFRDLIESGKVPTMRLTQIFRQAAKSSIIRYAHEINQGDVPRISSPISRPLLWSEKSEDCLFIDSEELTREQVGFIVRARRFYQEKMASADAKANRDNDQGGDENDSYFHPVIDESEQNSFSIPSKFAHVNLENLWQSKSEAEELVALLKKVHPWSALNFGLTASEMVRKLYLETIPRYLGSNIEIQVLSPMIRGSLGTSALNLSLQKDINPASEGKRELRIGDRTFREGDRVIQRRNNYDLGVFNGDIGIIREIVVMEQTVEVIFDVKTVPRSVVFKKENLAELELAYAITIHKSQGSEFDVVIIPVLTQHFKMLFRNLFYTGLTRAKKMAIFVGSRKALTMAIRNQDSRKRQTALADLL